MEMHKNIKLQNVTFSFSEQSKKFFDDLNIEFFEHTLNFIQGKNGVGKSTLLQVLSGEISKEHNLQGQLQIGMDIYDLSQTQKIAQLVARVPQNFNEILVEAYSFVENLQFAQMSRYPTLFQLPVKKQLPSLIKKYGIDNNRPVSLLSGGQRQILSILMVLERSPKVLLLDEPTAALDEENANIVMNFLQDLCMHQDLTVIAIVHNHELVAKYAPQGYFELVNERTKRTIRFIE